MHKNHIILKFKFSDSSKRFMKIVNDKVFNHLCKIYESCNLTVKSYPSKLQKNSKFNFLIRETLRKQ